MSLRMLLRRLLGRLLTAGDEAHWDRQFNESPALLDRLAEEALAEHRAGRTKPLNPGDL